MTTLVASGDQDERDLVLGVSAELIDTFRLDDCRFVVTGPLATGRVLRRSPPC